MNLIFLFFMLFGCSKKNPITWEECNNVVGDHPCDFTLVDQKDQQWNLYKNYGKIIVLDFSTEWCHFCHLAAEEIAHIEKTYENVIYVTILLEDRMGNPTTLNVVQEWAARFGIENSPVLIGTHELNWDYEGLPTFYIINEKMVVAKKMRGFAPNMVEKEIQDVINSSK